MISDVLSEALEKIKEYKKTCPESYVDNKEIAERLAFTVRVMRDMQKYLDTPPSRKEERFSPVDEWFKQMEREKKNK
jgi:hypothetical protein